MTIKEFCEKYAARNNETIRENLLKNNVKFVNYVPFNEKVVLAKAIINSTCFDESGEIKINSAAKYLFYIRTMITRYTDLISEDASFLTDYDALVSSGALNALIGRIDKSEIDEFQTILKMGYDDFIANSYETHSYVTKQVNRLVDVLNTIGTPIWETISDAMNSALKNYDETIDKANETIESIKNNNNFTEV